MKKSMTRRFVGLGAVALIALGIWIGAYLDFTLGLFGSQSGGGGEKPDAVDVTSDPLISNGVLKVRIEGQTIFVSGHESSVDEVARLAIENNAKVSIERGDDARRRAREELEQTLRDRDIHVVVE